MKRTDAERFADAVEKHLDLQADYLRSGQSDLRLALQRDAKRIRAMCDEILHPEQQQPSLFGNPAKDRPAH